MAGRTPTPCSCDMCRNPRHSKYYNSITKLTMQERKDLDVCKSSLEELNIEE